MSGNNQLGISAARDEIVGAVPNLAIRRLTLNDEMIVELNPFTPDCREALTAILSSGKPFVLLQPSYNHLIRLSAGQFQALVTRMKSDDSSAMAQIESGLRLEIMKTIKAFDDQLAADPRLQAPQNRSSSSSGLLAWLKSAFTSQPA